MSTERASGPNDTRGRFNDPGFGERPEMGLVSVVVNVFLDLLSEILFFKNPYEMEVLNQLWRGSFSLFGAVFLIQLMGYVTTLNVLTSTDMDTPYAVFERFILAVIFILISRPSFAFAIEFIHTISQFIYPDTVSITVAPMAVNSFVAFLGAGGVGAMFFYFVLYTGLVMTLIPFFILLTARAGFVYTVYAFFPLLMAFWCVRMKVFGRLDIIPKMSIKATAYFIGVTVFIAGSIATGGALANMQDYDGGENPPGVDAAAGVSDQIGVGARTTAEEVTLVSPYNGYGVEASHRLGINATIIALLGIYGGISLAAAIKFLPLSAIRKLQQFSDEGDPSRRGRRTNPPKREPPSRSAPQAPQNAGVPTEPKTGAGTITRLSTADSSEDWADMSSRQRAMSTAKGLLSSAGDRVGQALDIGARAYGEARLTAEQPGFQRMRAGKAARDVGERIRGVDSSQAADRATEAAGSAKSTAVDLGAFAAKAGLQGGVAAGRKWIDMTVNREKKVPADRMIDMGQKAWDDPRVRQARDRFNSTPTTVAGLKQTFADEGERAVGERHDVSNLMVVNVDKRTDDDGAVFQRGHLADVSDLDRETENYREAVDEDDMIEFVTFEDDVVGPNGNEHLQLEEGMEVNALGTKLTTHDRPDGQTPQLQFDKSTRLRQEKNVRGHFPHPSGGINEVKQKFFDGEGEKEPEHDGDDIGMFDVDTVDDGEQFAEVARTFRSGENPRKLEKQASLDMKNVYIAESMSPDTDAINSVGMLAHENTGEMMPYVVFRKSDDDGSESGEPIGEVIEGLGEDETVDVSSAHVEGYDTDKPWSHDELFEEEFGDVEGDYVQVKFDMSTDVSRSDADDGPEFGDGGGDGGDDGLGDLFGGDDGTPGVDDGDDDPDIPGPDP